MTVYPHYNVITTSTDFVENNHRDEVS